jgi:hypothetical protein
MDVIRKWINGGRNYQVGVTLYLTFGDDDTLKKLFTQEHETEYKRKRLLAALQELINTKKDAVEPIQSNSSRTQEPPPKTDLNSWPQEPISDKVISALKARWRPKFAEMMSLSQRLWDMTTVSERGEAAHRILDLDDQCDEIYAERDFYLAYNRLPDTRHTESVTDPLKWPQKLANAQRYVRDYRIKCAKYPDNPRFAAKLKQYEEEVKRYKSLLKIDIEE